MPYLLGFCVALGLLAGGVLGPARPVGEIDEHQIMIEATGAATATAAAGEAAGEAV
jgi:hypothetical protein